MDTSRIRNMALDILMAERINKSAVKEYIRETQSLADAYDGVTNLKVVQEAGMKQSKEIFGLVKTMHKMYKIDN
jgi:hypothetical protein